MNRILSTCALVALFVCLSSAQAQTAVLFGDGPLCGNGNPDPGEECDDGNTMGGDGCSATCQLESGQFYCTDPVAAVTQINLLPDGSFENDNANGDWAEISHSAFGSLLCDDDCFSTPLAADSDGNFVSGRFVLVSGGTTDQATSGVVEHRPVLFPETATTLSFYFAVAVPGVICPEPDDGLRLFIDGQEVWSNPAPGDACQGSPLPYQNVDVDISAFADNQPHTIRFEGKSSVNVDQTVLVNIFLDQVRLMAAAPDPQPAISSQCFLLACGDGVQTPDEQCDDGNILDADGCSASCEIEQPNFVCDDGRFPADNFNVIANGGFESGDNGSWIVDGPGSSPLCSQALCARNNPLGDAFYAWFRGETMGEARTLSQTINIPTTAEALVFDLRLGDCDGSPGTLEVLIDGAVVFVQDCTVAPAGDTAVIDVSAFADDGQYLLSLRHTASGETNFFVDNVRLRANVPFAGQASVCSALAAACNTPETFDSGLPADWIVLNASTNPAEGWGTSDDGVCGSNGWLGGNVTRGGGAAACADSAAAVQAIDSYLCSPALDVANVTQPVLSFLANFQARSNGAGDLDSLEVLIGAAPPSAQSVENYVPVAAVIDHLDGDELRLSPAGLVHADLAAFADQSEVHACFRYRGDQAWFAQIDNVALRGAACVAPTDQDQDGVVDALDNCTLLWNASQLDTDGDGHGNACDADFNDDCTVNAVDLGIFRTLFFGMNNEADLNGDGVTAFIDLGILRTLFFQTPGPSAGGICNE